MKTGTTEKYVLVERRFLEDLLKLIDELLKIHDELRRRKQNGNNGNTYI